MKKNFKDLQEFIECLDLLGELRKIESPVSPEIEISKIVDAESKKPGGGKALLFENVVDNGKKTFPVAANLFGNEKRMALAIGAKTLAQSGDRIAEIARMSPPRSFSDIFAAAKKLFPLVKIFPKKISGAAPCQVGLEIALGKGYACRHAVDGDSYLRSVRFAPERHSESVAPRVHFNVRLLIQDLRRM